MTVKKPNDQAVIGAEGSGTAPSPEPRKNGPASQLRLWTPIANAFVAYRSRWLDASDQEYELAWRLIHLNEAMVVCLGHLVATRLFHHFNLQGDVPEFRARRNVLRKYLAGSEMQPDTDQIRLPDDACCFDGRIPAWTHFLSAFVAFFEEWAAGDEVLQGFKEYLATPVRRQREDTERGKAREGADFQRSPIQAFEHWNEIASSPFPAAENTRVGLFKAINEVRNKVAHVPIDFRTVARLHLALRQDLLASLFRSYQPDKDSPEKDPEPDKVAPWPALCGALESGRCRITGHADTKGKMSSALKKEGVWAEAAITPGSLWRVSPFISVEPHQKVSVLYWLERFSEPQSQEEDAIVSADFYRFSAEFQPQTRKGLPRAALAALEVELPPRDDSPPGPELPPSSTSPDPREAMPGAAEATISLDPWELRRNAWDAFKAGRFVEARRLYEELSTAPGSDVYNDVARSRHAGAMWRSALKETPADFQSLERAQQLLQQSLQHRDPGYRATSFHDLSKLLWHRAKIEPSREKDLLEASLKYAVEAAKLTPEDRFLSWYERVQQDLTRKQMEHGERAAEP